LSRATRAWPPLALTLLALAVRLQQLTYHSLWFDEAMSVYWARSGIARILEVSMNLVEDRLPPLYYLSLHYWRALAGDGEFAVRLPSVLLGTLLAPVVYRLAGDMLGRRAALLAAALAALNPFLVWYAQEARMYAQAALLGALGTWFYWLSVRHSLEPVSSGRRRAAGWLAYGLCALAGLYTHLYTGMLLPAHALYLLLAGPRARRAWIPFALTMLAVAGLFAPLALATWRASAEAGPGDPLAGLAARWWWLLSAFTVWKAPLPPALAAAVTGLLAGLALLGFALPDPGRRSPGPRIPPRPRLLLGLLLLAPPLLATLLLWRNRVAFFGERYFIIAVPWLLIAAAAGAAGLAARLRTALAKQRQLPRPASCASAAVHFRDSGFRHAPPGAPLANTSLPSGLLGRLLPAACYLLPITLTLLPLPGQWSAAARKEAWRETAAQLAAHARPEDAILIHPDWTRYPLQYYFRGPGQTYAVFGSVERGAGLEAPLAAISTSHPVVWLVESHTELADPGHQVNAWLAARFPAVTELYPPGLVAVRAYAPGYLSDRLPGFAAPLPAEFEGGLRLAGYWLPQARVQAGDDLFHPPSGWLHVALYWMAEALPANHYTPFVHLIDGQGQVWGAALDRPNDAFDFYPATRWQRDQVVRLDLDVNLNPITPPGRYMLVAGLRDGSGVQVPLADGSPQVFLAPVEVVGN
jgi:hypothetical protein